jgi:CHASE1-domain containing sensor protein
MKRAIIVAVMVLLIGLGVVYLSLRLTCEMEAMKSRLEAMKDRDAQQAEELRKLKEELGAERGRRQRLEEVIRQRRR